MHAPDIDHAARLLAAGGLVAFPTETVYGLGADASLPTAVARVFAVKRRPVDHPLIIHLADADALSRWAADVPAAAHTLAGALWPGPLTLVLRKAEHVGMHVTGALSTVGLRVPAHPVALALLRAHGGGIAAPSANRFGSVSPTTAAHVRRDLGDDIDLVLDGGPCEVGIESTIVDLSRGDDDPVILRPGGASRERIEALLGRAVPVREGGEVRSPGQLPSHYAPAARVIVTNPARLAATVAEQLRVNPEAKLGVIAAAEGVTPPRWTRGEHGVAVRIELDPHVELARHLYGCLRQLDDEHCTVIVATLPPPAELGLAIADRMRRAAGPRDGDGRDA
ncbi:MAG: threonylcarbamoyl-AMP synthase [Deltaproteobacteria bacterium]|nr:threonylcarbamoyl-AMP synthase [Deltaproteobacteria bacterium]